MQTRRFVLLVFGVAVWWPHCVVLGGGALKHNNYEGATRNAMIISVPNSNKPGQTTHAIAQSLDIGPTLFDLCGLPPCEGFEGRSLRPILEDPDRRVNEAAFSWYPKRGYLGVAMRTDRWRFVEWTKPGEDPIFELYDQSQDPQNDVNLAGRPEHAALLKTLARQLHQRIR